MTRRAFAALALAAAICGCHAPESSQTGGRQTYRAWVTTAAGDQIPFFLEMPDNCNTDRAGIVNGTERISIPCQRLGDRVLFDFIVYGTRDLRRHRRQPKSGWSVEPCRRSLRPNDSLGFSARPIDASIPRYGSRRMRPMGPRRRRALT